MDKVTGKANDLVLFLMQADREQLFDLTEHKNKRSLDSNAYFHVLADKLRQRLNVSMAYIKNHLIADYGQIEYIDDEPMIYKTNAPEEYMMELETLHSKCVKVTEENGHNIYFYRIYRGSHTYNSAEMSKLIEGTISECQQNDIETATPEELKHMQELWERKCTRGQRP